MTYCHNEGEIKPHRFVPCWIPGLCMYFEDWKCHLKICIAEESDPIHTDAIPEENKT
jgi:hypothetical protein